jgi:hypothetical protein
MSKSRTVRFAIVSDLHYVRHKKDEPCRPSVASSGPHADPMVRLHDLLSSEDESLVRDDGTIADYLICPGDIGDRADPAAFEEGWSKLKTLNSIL